jgi:hypothetical protein
MTDDELKEKIKEVLAEYRTWTGQRDISVEEMALFQPRLGTVMVEVGQRTWTLYYAAKAGNWKMAKSQWEEIQELMQVGAFQRPKYAEELNKFIAEDWPAIGKAIEDQNFEAFEPAFRKAIEQANAYHDLKYRPFIQWKLPDFPPPGLDLTPRSKK